jgi:hypothetical protein
MTETERRVQAILGILSVSPDKEVIDELIEFLDPDHIPPDAKPSPGEDDIINIRKAPVGMRCSTTIGDDIQSGPIYCGKVANVIADSKKYPEMIYAMCKDHNHSKSAKD